MKKNNGDKKKQWLCQCTKLINRQKNRKKRKKRNREGKMMYIRKIENAISITNNSNIYFTNSKGLSYILLQILTKAKFMTNFGAYIHTNSKLESN